MPQQAIKTIRTLLPFTGSITKNQIESAVDSALMIPAYSEINRDFLIREVESLYNIRMDDFRIIEAEERRIPWIGNVKSNISWNFWNRYRDYLQVEKNYADTVLNQIDKLTDRTLDGLFNPTENIVISKYGLVVGQVQSGKTSNYTGLICKAADSGFKLIIVLAGIHNNLRSQTQLRLDEGFLGFDTQHQRAFDQNGVTIGVGRLDQKSVAHSLTSSLDKGDFTSGAANSMGINFNTSEPIIAVVKKNSKVLERLLLWLSAQTEELPDGRKVIRNKSLLLIDDEADNASINTNKEDDKSTRINEHIRNILRLFDKSGYVGYTATPFANIFIPIKEDDLFPRDFIINIPAPSNYVGPEKVFGIKVLEDDDESDTVLPIVNRVDDYSDLIPNGHKGDSEKPDHVPESLKTAIKCFIITCTIRRLRGQINVHNSMLIHVSRYISWQSHIKTLVENTFDFYRRGIEMKIPSIIEEIRIAFEEDHEYTYDYKTKSITETITEKYKSFKSVSQSILDTNPEIDSQVKVHGWNEVLPHLHDAVSKIQVREINGGSKEALDYYQAPVSIIAIGGDKLSRGLTLEGLSVSYYLRASRMYDTLMQMGRWFGYRPGYVDLCRLFTSRELNEWFCHITLASEELRSEFDYMADVAGSTPEQYALKVRTHPGVLQISASNKIRRAVNVDVSWSGRLVESYQLQKNPKTIHLNLDATKSLINSLSSNFKTESNHFLWKDIPVDLIRPFFQKFRVSENLKKVEPAKLLDYIDISVKSNELTNWNVALVTKRNAYNSYPLNSQNGINEVGCVIRSNDKNKNDENNLHIIKNHIIRPKDEFFDLSTETYIKALERTKAFVSKHNQGDEYKNDFPKGEIVRNEFRDPKTALLLIYFIDSENAGMPKDSDPIVGFAISFPKSKSNHSVSYAVHQQLLPYFDIDDNIEEMDDDED
jgi:hypothetical protein